MILPVIFIVGLLCLGLKHKPAQSVTVSGYPSRYGMGTIRVERMEPKNKYRRILSVKIRNRQPVTRWLVDNAMLEAFNDGDIKMVEVLARTFRKPKPPASEKHASEKQEPEDASEKQGDASEKQLSELGQPPLRSPLDGVSDEDWMEFVARVRTKPPGFKSEKYVGQYEQNKGRLQQLGIAEPSNSEQEYEALAQDMAGHFQDSTELIGQWSGDVVDIQGTEHPVCPSGILGLLKSAGPEGARSWLTNPSDRTQFPKTTEAFLRTNGCF